MKKKDSISFCVLIMSVFFVLTNVVIPIGVLWAYDVRLEWDANIEADIAGYKLYYDTDSSGPTYDGTGINPRALHPSS